jgi:hypothetical protein
MFEWLMRRILKYLRATEVKQRSYALGFNSYTNVEKDQHMLFLDYDVDVLGFVIDDCNELCTFFNLCDFEIYKTKKGYHVFWWGDNNLPYSRIRLIIDYSRCDIMFKYIRKYYKYATIRAVGKYKEPDIHYVGRFKGKRTPSPKEREIGGLKKREYEALKSQNQNLFKPEVLK